MLQCSNTTYLQTLTTAVEPAIQELCMVCGITLGRDKRHRTCKLCNKVSTVYLSSLSVNTQRKVFKFIRFPSRIVDNLSRVCRTKYWLHLNTRTHSECLCLNAFEYEGWVFTRYKWSRDYDNNKWICKAIRVFEYQWSVHGRVKEVEHHRIA